VLRVGEEIRRDGRDYIVHAIMGRSVELTDAVGAIVTVTLAELLNDPGLELVSGSASRPQLVAQETLEGVPPEVVDRARWWQGHVVELLTGRPAGAPETAPSSPAYGPALRSLR